MSILSVPCDEIVSPTDLRTGHVLQVGEWGHALVTRGLEGTSAIPGDTLTVYHVRVRWADREGQLDFRADRRLRVIRKPVTLGPRPLAETV